MPNDPNRQLGEHAPRTGSTPQPHRGVHVAEDGLTVSDSGAVLTTPPEQFMPYGLRKDNSHIDAPTEGGDPLPKPRR